MTTLTPAPKTPTRLTLAWGVHLLTASGAVVGALALIAILEGSFAVAGVLMMLGLAIDSIDGTLARRAHVEQLIPRVDGRRLDDIVDFLNFVIVPVVFMVASGHLSSSAFAVAPILASAYGFSQHDAKTEDDFFLGWPSYWNIVALYLWLLDLSPGAGTLWVLALSVAVFVPITYVYPSRLRVLRRTTNVAGLIWGLFLTAAILFPVWANETGATSLSLIYPAYYFALSFWLGNLRTVVRTKLGAERKLPTDSR